MAEHQTEGDEITCDGCGELIGKSELKLPVWLREGDMRSLTYFVHNDNPACLQKFKLGMLNGTLNRYLE